MVILFVVIQQVLLSVELSVFYFVLCVLITKTSDNIDFDNKLIK